MFLEFDLVTDLHSVETSRERIFFLKIRIRIVDYTDEIVSH